jgi:hypothetical protein
MPKPSPLILLVADPDPIRAAQGCKVSATHHAGRYPMVNLKRRGKSTTTPMARWLLGLYRGRALRRGEEAMHEVCDNSRCIAIEHLKVGTRSENEKHKWLIGRGVMPRLDTRGEKNGQSKLTAAKVRSIRRAASRVSQRAMAKKFRVTEQAISLIVTGRTWRHLAA